jgi:hypothetical protein
VGCPGYLLNERACPKQDEEDKRSSKEPVPHGLTASGLGRVYSAWRSSAPAGSVVATASAVPDADKVDQAGAA